MRRILSTGKRNFFQAPFLGPATLLQGLQHQPPKKARNGPILSRCEFLEHPENITRERDRKPDVLYGNAHAESITPNPGTATHATPNEVRI